MKASVDGRRAAGAVTKRSRQDGG